MSAEKKLRNTPSRDLDAEIGKRAHMLMWGEGLKQGDVAARINMSSGSLGLKLKGNRGWAASEIVALAAELGTTVGYLFGETENPHSGVPSGGHMVGPAGIEPTTSTVESRQLAPVIRLSEWKTA